MLNIFEKNGVYASNSNNSNISKKHNYINNLDKNFSVSYSYPKRYRIQDKNIFKSLLENRPQAKHDIFNVHISYNDKQTPRLGLIIGKRFCRKAVTRNKIKRIIREAFRLSVPLLANIDILFRLKHSIFIKNKKDNKFYQQNIHDIMVQIKQKHIKQG